LIDDYLRSEIQFFSSRKKLMKLNNIPCIENDGWKKVYEEKIFAEN